MRRCRGACRRRPALGRQASVPDGMAAVGRCVGTRQRRGTAAACSGRRTDPRCAPRAAVLYRRDRRTAIVQRRADQRSAARRRVTRCAARRPRGRVIAFEQIGGADARSQCRASTPRSPCLRPGTVVRHQAQVHCTRATSGALEPGMRLGAGSTRTSCHWPPGGACRASEAGEFAAKESIQTHGARCPWQADCTCSTPRQGYDADAGRRAAWATTGAQLEQRTANGMRIFRGAQSHIFYKIVNYVAP